MKRRRRPATPPAICLQTGKIGYGRRFLAHAAARALQAQDDEPMNAYLCPFCERWHVGHDKRRRP